MAQEVTTPVNESGKTAMEVFGFDSEILRTKANDMLKEIYKKAKENEGKRRPSDFVPTIEENFSKRELAYLFLNHLIGTIQEKEYQKVKNRCNEISFIWR